MFDFFRKDKGSPRPAVPEPTPADTPPATPAPPTAPSDGGMKVDDGGHGLSPALEEAVILYATGRTGEATAALTRYILNHPDNRDPEPWRMLFDLYEVTGQQAEFEDLAMDFAVRFERSPPTWRAQSQTEPGASGNPPRFAFGTKLSAEDQAALGRFMRECAAADAVVLDFNATPVPDSETYARALLECLARLAGSGKAIRLLGGDAFVVRLNASRAGGRLSEPLWLLLLQLLQLQGKAEEFESVALDYAVRFEMSPPSYTPPRRVAAAEATRGGPSGEVFPLYGVISPAEASVFADLRTFAADLARVEIDLSQVSRVDFMVVGLLMDTVATLAQSGRQVAFKDGNEMVNLLLRMVGVGQFATIQPKHRK